MKENAAEKKFEAQFTGLKDLNKQTGKPLVNGETLPYTLPKVIAPQTQEEQQKNAEISDQFDKQAEIQTEQEQQNYETSKDIFAENKSELNAKNPLGSIDFSTNDSSSIGTQRMKNELQTRYQNRGVRALSNNIQLKLERNNFDPQALGLTTEELKSALDYIKNHRTFWTNNIDKTETQNSGYVNPVLGSMMQSGYVKTQNGMNHEEYGKHNLELLLKNNPDIQKPNKENEIEMGNRAEKNLELYNKHKDYNFVKDFGAGLINDAKDPIPLALMIGTGYIGKGVGIAAKGVSKLPIVNNLLTKPIFDNLGTKIIGRVVTKKGTEKQAKAIYVKNVEKALNDLDNVLGDTGAVQQTSYNVTNRIIASNGKTIGKITSKELRLNAKEIEKILGSNPNKYGFFDVTSNAKQRIATLLEPFFLHSLQGTVFSGTALTRYNEDKLKYGEEQAKENLRNSIFQNIAMFNAFGLIPTIKKAGKETKKLIAKNHADIKELDKMKNEQIVYKDKNEIFKSNELTPYHFDKIKGRNFGDLTKKFEENFDENYKNAFEKYYKNGHLTQEGMDYLEPTHKERLKRSEFLTMLKELESKELNKIEKKALEDIGELKSFEDINTFLDARPQLKYIKQQLLNKIKIGEKSQSLDLTSDRFSKSNFVFNNVVEDKENLTFYKQNFELSDKAIEELTRIENVKDDALRNEYIKSFKIEVSQNLKNGKGEYIKNMDEDFDDFEYDDLDDDSEDYILNTEPTLKESTTYNRHNPYMGSEKGDSVFYDIGHQHDFKKFRRDIRHEHTTFGRDGGGLSEPDYDPLKDPNRDNFSEQEEEKIVDKISKNYGELHKWLADPGRLEQSVESRVSAHAQISFETIKRDNPELITEENIMFGAETDHVEIAQKIENMQAILEKYGLNMDVMDYGKRLKSQKAFSSETEFINAYRDVTNNTIEELGDIYKSNNLDALDYTSVKGSLKNIVDDYVLKINYKKTLDSHFLKQEYLNIFKTDNDLEISKILFELENKDRKKANMIRRAKLSLENRDNENGGKLNEIVNQANAYTVSATFGSSAIGVLFGDMMTSSVADGLVNASKKALFIMQNIIGRDAAVEEDFKNLGFEPTETASKLEDTQDRRDISHINSLKKIKKGDVLPLAAETMVKFNRVHQITNAGELYTIKSIMKNEQFWNDMLKVGKITQNDLDAINAIKREDGTFNVLDLENSEDEVIPRSVKIAELIHLRKSQSMALANRYVRTSMMGNFDSGSTQHAIAKMFLLYKGFSVTGLRMQYNQIFNDELTKLNGGKYNYSAAAKLVGYGIGYGALIDYARAQLTGRDMDWDIGRNWTNWMANTDIGGIALHPLYMMASDKSYDRPEAFGGSVFIGKVGKGVKDLHKGNYKKALQETAPFNNFYGIRIVNNVLKD